MTVLETPLGSLELRSDQVQLATTLERHPLVTPAGVRTVEGDGGWSPESVTITLNVADPSHADGVAAVEQVVSRLRAATRLTTLSRAAAVVALRQVRRVNRGVHWEVSAELVIGPWTSLLIANALTVLGQTVTVSGESVTVEVH